MIDVYFNLQRGEIIMKQRYQTQTISFKCSKDLDNTISVISNSLDKHRSQFIRDSVIYRLDNDENVKTTLQNDLLRCSLLK